MLLENDIQECLKDLKTIFNEFDLLPEQAQHVLVDMRFNLGYKGFRKFKKMIKAVNQQDFHSTAREMRDTLWYHQVGKRAERLTEMMQVSADLADTVSGFLKCCFAPKKSGAKCKKQGFFEAIHI